MAAVRQSAGAAIPGLAADPATAPVAGAAKEALSEATRYTAYTAAGFLLLGLLASARLSRGTRQPDLESVAA